MGGGVGQEAGVPGAQRPEASLTAVGEGLITGSCGQQSSTHSAQGGGPPLAPLLPEPSCGGSLSPGADRTWGGSKPTELRLFHL